MDYSFVSREVEIYFPYPAEFPQTLLARAGVDDAQMRVLAQAPLVRVAKYREQVVGAYATLQREASTYEVVALSIDQEHQGRGLGRWLLGHALGVAEAKGGRSVFVRDERIADASRSVCEHILRHCDFVLEAERWWLRITPE